MNCEELNMELCGSCMYSKGIKADLTILTIEGEQQCLIDFFYTAAHSSCKSKKSMAEYILFCLNDSVFGKQYKYLSVMINIYYPEYVGLYDTILLLK